MKFIKLTKKLLLICNIYSTKLNPIAAILGSISPMITNCPLIILILYVMPFTLFISFAVCNTYNILIYQCVYFYLICYYLKIKLKTINESIRKLIKNKCSLNNNLLYNIMRSTNSIYSEIDDCNNNYWSLYLFCFWISITAIINIALFIGIFSRIFLMRILFSFSAMAFTSGLVIIIRSASFVSLESNKSYKLMYSLVFSKKEKTFF